MQHALPDPMEHDEDPAAPDPRCEDLDLDAEISPHPCAECDRPRGDCYCAAAEG